MTVIRSYIPKVCNITWHRLILLHVMSTHKNISGFIINITNTLVSLGKIAVKTRAWAKLPTSQGKHCLVLGNGPSLKAALAQKPEHFRNKSLICVNSFALSDDYVKLQPRYCVMLDPGLWKANHDYIVNTMAALKEKTTWEFHLIIPHEAKISDRIRSLSENPNIKIHYFNYIVYKGFEGIGHYLFRKNLAMPQSQNVLVASLFFAINLGYEKIEMFGADHNWHESLAVREDNVVCVKQVHFYENENEVKYIPFYKPNSRQETFRMDEAFHAWAKVFYGYIRLRNYAESRGAKIYNATEKSFVDAFERISI